MKLTAVIPLTLISSVLICLGISLHAQIQPKHAIEIDSVIGTGNDAIRIKYADDNGVDVESALVGVKIGSAGFHGVQVVSAGGNGVYVNSTSGSGVTVESAVNNGVYVGSAGTGVFVNSASSDGVRVDNAGGDGVFVYSADIWSMNIQGSKNEDATPAGHIAQIYNRATGGSADVLALKVGLAGNPNGGSNFITFFNGNDVGVGRIEGNGTGGVTYGTTGADFAEHMPMYASSEQIEPGDIVGILDGKITKQTDGVTQVMVITDRAAFLGNQQEEDQGYKKVSFIGQVDVKVWGPVTAGDWIVASGKQDGTGIAVSSRDISLDHLIVGRAWESNDDPSIKRVNTAIGLDHSQAKDEIIRNMDEEVMKLKDTVKQLQEQIDVLTRLVEKI